MKMATAACLVSLLVFGAASAQEPVPAPKCIRPFDSPTGSILRTSVVDPQTVLFYMRDGKVWKNTLRGPCRGLLFHGFSFLARHDEICANAQSIQVIETGEVCQLGQFSAYTPPTSP